MNRFPLPDDEDLCLPDVDTIHWVHDEVALFEGGTKGLRDQGSLVSALNRPLQVLSYSEERPDLVTLASYLCHGIAMAHAYVDGNKRTAVLAMMAFLAQNGVSYDAGEDEIGRLIDLWFERQMFSVDVLDSYLRTRCHWAKI